MKIGKDHVPQNVQIGEVSKDNPLPPGAVVLNVQEVMEVQDRIIQNWKPKKELWPLTHATLIIGGLAATSGLIFEAHFRHKFNLRFHGRLSTLVPSMFIPAVTSAVMHKTLVTDSILMKRLTCPLCAEIRSAVLLTSFGVVQPFILGFLSSVIVSRIKYTIAVPHISHYKIWSEFAIKQSAPLKIPFLGLLCAGVGLGFILAHQEGKAAVKVWNEMSKDNLQDT